MKAIELGNSYEYSFGLFQKNATTGEKEAAEGLTGITARIAAEDEGTAVDPSLELPVQERAAAPGKYFVLWDRDDLEAHLVPGKYFLVVDDGTDTLLSTPVRVKRPRRT